jgi:hypothetical protein
MSDGAHALAKWWRLQDRNVPLRAVVECQGTEEGFLLTERKLEFFAFDEHLIATTPQEKRKRGDQIRSQQHRSQKVMRAGWTTAAR